MSLFKKELSRHTEFVCILFSLLYIALGSNDTLNTYDEGVAVTGAMRVLNGEIPYRDFWTMYAPGQYYFLAALFKLFGQSLIIERIFSVLILWGIALTAWKISKLFLSKNLALIVLLLQTLWIASYRFYGSPLASALLLAILASYFTLLFFKNSQPKYLFLAGIFCGLTAIFRHDLGAYTMIALSFTIIAKHFRHFSSDVFNDVFKNFSHLLLGITLVSLPVALYFLNVVPLKVLTDQLIKFPATTFEEYRALPFPTVLDIFKSTSFKKIVKTLIELCSFYFPIAVFTTAILMFLKKIFRKNHDLHNPPFAEVALLTLMCMIYMMQVSVRADVSHLLAAIIPAVIISVFLFKNSWFLPRFKNLFIIIIRVLGIGAFTGAVFVKAMVIKDYVLKPKYSLQTARANYVSGDEFLKEYDNLLQFLKANSANGEKIFVGSIQHDKIVNNDVMLYFLSNRLPATKYHELHPGAATSEPVQREIVNDILKNNVQLIVLNELISTVIEPNKSSVSSGVYLLDEFIKINFHEVAKFDDYTVLKRVGN